jgi:single-stranded-DNA-specific exonuclease
LFEPNWHQGVIGIIAGRIKELFHRPVIAFASVSTQEIKGSARSIGNVHIRDVLESIATKYPHLMSKFGGHAMAAGLTLELQHYPAFCRAFDQEVCRYISADDIQGKIFSDGELMPDDLHIHFAQLLRDAGPWGQHFPEPLFDGHFKLLEQRIVAGKHLKLRLEHKKSNHYIDAIAFGVDLTRWPNEQIKEIKAAYKLDINEYRGLQSVQLLIEHLEPA